MSTNSGRKRGPMGHGHGPVGPMGPVEKAKDILVHISLQL